MLKMESLVNNEEEMIEGFYNGEHDFILNIDIEYITDEILLKLYDLSLKLSKNDEENYNKIKVDYSETMEEFIMINYIESRVYTDPEKTLCKQRYQTIKITEKLQEMITQLREYEINKSRWGKVIKDLFEEIKKRKLDV